MQDKVAFVYDMVAKLGQFEDLEHCYKGMPLSDNFRSALKHAGFYNTLPTRSALLSASCRAVGGELTEATHLAGKAMELFAGFLHIHDDIIDATTATSSLYFPSTASQYGDHVALVIGDVLLLRATLMLCRALNAILTRDKVERVMDELEKAGSRIADVQIREIGLRGQLDIAEDEYLEMAQAKTAEFEMCTKIGALMGNGDEEEVVALSEYGRRVGTMLLLKSDMLDLLYRRDLLLSRLKNEVAPFPVLLAVSCSNRARDFFASLVDKDTITDNEWLQVFQLVSESKAIDQTRNVVKKLGAEAKCLIRNTGEKEIKRFLEALIDVTQLDDIHSPLKEDV